MSRRRTGKTASAEARKSDAGDTLATPTAADRAPPLAVKELNNKELNKEPKEPAKARRRRNTAGFEERIGYRFNDPALLEQALSHISA